MNPSPEKPQVVIYTDGACEGNPGPGGWAAILRYGRHEKVLRGGASDTTNNRMELRAAIEALRALKRPCVVHLPSMCGGVLLSGCPAGKPMVGEQLTGSQ